MSRELRLAYGLGPFIRYLDSQGIDVDHLLDRAGIPRLAIDEPSCQISLEQEIAFTLAALRRIPASDAGLRVGQTYHLNLFGVLGLAASACDDVQSTLRLFFEHPLLAWGMFELSLWRDERHAWLQIEDRVDLGDCRGFFAERDITCFVTVLRDLLGREVRPVRVAFAHAARGPEAPYRRFFGCEVVFSAPAAGILMDARVLEMPLPQANETSRRLFEAQCRALSRTLEAPSDYAELVRRWLRRSTPIGSIRDIAAALALNERTLQRRLAAEGTSFTALLREIRLERSRQYLQLRHMSLQDIAERLGYRDSVAFCHAYKEWTGQAPRGSTHRTHASEAPACAACRPAGSNHGPGPLRRVGRRAGGREA
jgi:AraC-like DNA-binding protein